MKNYIQDVNATNWPFCESPFFYDLVNHQNLTEDEKIACIKFHTDGYYVLDLNLDSDTLKEMKKEIDTINLNENKKLQDSGYHYSKGNRIFEAWKISPLLKSLSLNDKVLNILNLFYRRKPIPFQTITFDYGSNQPLHSDTIHFHSMPHRWLAAAWIALEDMDEENGSLVYVPGSHKLPIFDFYDLKIKSPEFGKQFDEYKEYENFVNQLVESNKLSKKLLKCKAGSVLIWASNLLHGGDIIRNDRRSRYSQVTHYYFDGCDKYFSPMFSESWNGKYSEKNLKQKDFYNV